MDDTAPDSDAFTVAVPVPADLVFVTVPPKAAKREPVTFTLDGRTLTATRPKDAILANLVGMTSRTGANTGDMVAGIQNFLARSLDPESWQWLQGRLDDNDDDLEYDHLTAIIEALMTHWLPEANDTKRGSNKRGARRP